MRTLKELAESWPISAGPRPCEGATLASDWPIGGAGLDDGNVVQGLADCFGHCWHRPNPLLPSVNPNGRKGEFRRESGLTRDGARETV